VETLLKSERKSRPFQLALDTVRGRLLWADQGGNGVCYAVLPLVGNANEYGQLRFGSGDSLTSPQGIAIDPVDGSVFVSDTGNQRIVRLVPTDLAAWNTLPPPREQRKMAESAHSKAAPPSLPAIECTLETIAAADPKDGLPRVLSCAYGLAHPSGLAFSANGDILWVADSVLRRLNRPITGTATGTATGTVTGTGASGVPCAWTLWTVGNDSSIFGVCIDPRDPNIVYAAANGVPPLRIDLRTGTHAHHRFR
jgi:DNA-binding beta-propeller fold protein YncE